MPSLTMETVKSYIEFLKEISIWGNSVYDYVLAAVTFIALLLGLKIFQMIILAYLKKLAKKTKTDIDDALIRIFKGVKPPFYFFVALYFSIKTLTLPELVNQIIGVIFILIIAYEVISALEKFIDYGVEKYARTKDVAVSSSLVKIFKIVAKIALWLLALTIVLSNFGLNVTSLIAGLGIGGIAVALAAQSILGDVFSSFSIFIDRPFEEGDFIKAGTEMGTVKQIGLKSTRIQSVDGEELVIPNKDLTDARLQNFGRMEKRRALFPLGVVYGTHPDKLKKVPKIIENVVSEIDEVEFSRCHFKDYGDFSLNYEVVYFVKSADYKSYLDKRQQINLEIYQKFKEEGIEFAYPTQTLFVNK